MLRHSFGPRQSCCMFEAPKFVGWLPCGRARMDSVLGNSLLTSPHLRKSSEWNPVWNTRARQQPGCQWQLAIVLSASTVGTPITALATSSRHTIRTSEANHVSVIACSVFISVAVRNADICALMSCDGFLQLKLTKYNRNIQGCTPSLLPGYT